MANPSNEPGRRDGDPGTESAEPGRAPAATEHPERAPGDAELAATGARADFADEAGLRQTGRDDDLDGDMEGERTPRAGIEDRTVPSLEGSPIGPDTGRARGHDTEHDSGHATGHETGHETGHDAGHAGHHHGEEHDDHHARPGFAATALKILIFVLVIFGLSLWLVPIAAPHLPAGLARMLMPGQAELDQRLAALADRIEENTAQISSDVAAMRDSMAALAEQLGTVEETATAARTEAEAARAAAEGSAASAEQNVVAGDTVSRAETAARDASGLAETATTAATEAGKVASAAARDTASLARRMTEFDARLAALSDQIEAVNQSLAGGGADGEAAAPELAAAVAALQSEVDALEEQLGDSPDLVTETEAQRFATQDDLRSARTALEAQIAEAIAALPEAGQIVVGDQLDQLRQNAEARVQEVIGRLDQLETAAAQAADTAASAEQAATDAVGRVDEAIRQASLRSAAAALISRLENGLPYAGALDEAAALQGDAVPEALAGPAETGVATVPALIRRFGQAARAALEADMEARAGDGLLAQASARVRSVVAGRPASELPGETADAILSRVEARLREGDAAAALAEAESLPEPARAALGDWIDDLRVRVAAAESARGWLGAADAAGTGG